MREETVTGLTLFFIWHPAPGMWDRQVGIFESMLSKMV
jgi:hypothetical protein